MRRPRPASPSIHEEGGRAAWPASRDPAGFDVVVNTAALGVAGAVKSIAAALAGVP